VWDGLLYFSLCLVIALFVRVLHSFMKAWGVKSGEHEEFSNVYNPNGTVGELAWTFFCGFNGDRHDDNWIPFGIGFLEIFVYPFLFHDGQVNIIGVWLVFKTIAQWNTWAKKHGSFNRFLLTNLFNLIISYIIALNFIVDISH
jgi:hypothetical protein